MEKKEFMLFVPDKVLVTGCCGFIGSHLCEKLLQEEVEVLGIDNMNDYYNIEMKKDNLKLLEKYEDFTFCQEDIRTTKKIEE